MAVITYQRLFDSRDIEDFGIFKRLQFIIDKLADEELMKYLNNKGKKGRKDYTIHPIWNTLISVIIEKNGFVLRSISIADTDGYRMDTQ